MPKAIPVETLEKHLPATVPFPCWGRLAACRIYTEAQLWGYTVSQLAHAMNRRTGTCKDCDLFHAKMRLEKAEKDRAEQTRKQRIKERANRQAMQAIEQEDED